MELFLSFMIVAVVLGIIILPIYVMGVSIRKAIHTGEKVDVHVDPSDAKDNYIEGGDKIDREAIARVIYPHPKHDYVVSEEYKPKQSVAVRDYSRFHYDRKSHLMSKAERGFYKRLENIFPEDCYIFPQVHLDDILKSDSRDKSENWKAWAHIRAKSIDYLICDNDFRIRLAIELDDWSHDFETRKHRDTEVERVFRDADLPLLRCRNIAKISDAELKRRIIEQFRNHERHETHAAV